MASIEDLKNYPTTGRDIILDASAPAVDDDEVVATPTVATRPNTVKVNIGAASNTNTVNPNAVRRPKTFIAQKPPVVDETAHTATPAAREELDLSTLPASETNAEYEKNTKVSPLDDIAADIDQYLDDKEIEIKEAYEEVSRNIAEKEAEKELNNDVDSSIDTDDDLDSLISGETKHPVDDEEDDEKEEDVLADTSDDLDSILNDDDVLDDISISKNIIAPATTTDDSAESGDEDDDEVQEDSEKELTEEAEDNSREAYLAKLKALATEKLKPAAKRLNLNSYTILRKPTSNLNFLKQNAVAVAKWVLPNQGSAVFMREYLGIELEQLRRFSEDTNSPTSLTRKFKSIYDHIESPKPATFEAWLKSTPFSDIDHYFFGVFIASYQGTNYIPYDCKNDKCKATFLTDDIKIMDMVKFKDDEAKAKFKSIYQNEDMSSTKEGIYVSEIVQISDRFAIAFKEPTLYNVIENNSIDNDFRRRYADIINMIPCIDTIYVIDSESLQLIPIGYKIYDNNATKTFKSKIQKYNSVFKSLTNDEFTLVQSYVSSVISRESFMTYQYPEVECPDCHTVVPAVDTDAESAVFTRYQLGALVNTTLS